MKRLRLSRHFLLAALLMMSCLGVCGQEKVFDIVEQMPEFPGGQAGLLTWVSQNVKYPPIAEENGIQGRVFCTFVVEKDGSITDVKVARSIDPSLDKEAVRVLSSMPRWKPGRQDGKPVRVKYTVPIMFRLGAPASQNSTPSSIVRTNSTLLSIVKTKMNMVEKIGNHSVLHSFNLLFDKNAGAVNRYASKLFFDDSTTASLDLAINKFETEKELKEVSMAIASRDYNQKINYVLELKAMREGFYHCYNVAKQELDMTQGDVQAEFVQHNIIYDVRHDRLLTPEDIFVPQYVDTIRKAAQGKPVEMIMSDGIFIWAYRDDGSDLVPKELEYKDCDSLFVDSFLDLVGWKKVEPPIKVQYEPYVNLGARNRSGAVLKAKEIIKDETPKGGNKVFDVVEQMPEFPGGKSALLNWISNNIHYPAVAEENGIQGRVVCSFVVEEDGSITDVKVVRSVDPLLDKEAVRVLRSMPKWKPGKQKGVPLRVKYTAPVTFGLR